MDGAIKIQWRRGKCIQMFGRKTLKEIHHLEDTGIDKTIILKCILIK
jgi:hypothetical protein